MAQYFFDLVYTLSNCMSCFPGSPQLKINNRSFKILRLLGEGGFSYVYLVQDTSNEALYALKKIRCPFGQESVALAMKEVEAYALFSPHPNIIHSVDYCVSADRSDPGAKTVYILLPYYRRVSGAELMVLFLGVCKALKAMHNYKVGGGPGGVNSQNKAKRVRGQAAAADQEAAEEVELQRGRQSGREVDSDSEQQEPLMEGEVTRSQEGIAPGEIRAYAHRDIKPGNIMIDDDGEQPILMDLGSLATSPTPITSRSMALAVQDTAAEHSTMPYRAPELFDVKTGSVIDTKVDIWSLGCTLYACLVGKSPFEMRSDETGGSLSICVLSGDWRFPDEGAGGKKKAKNQAGQSEDSGISENIREVVRKCLKVEPAERPDVEELMTIVEEVIADLPEDGPS
ncbi:Serine/threonine-protein kinase [Lachnellula hyalina]|uniref:non-specific serine/threonine protein kinase n=1 Tax=Lachnellula hyalina TaxID=1316788 RepID=A0A8H8QUY0_9HELO|nr:Serine/threonine-protein kinase [Lachnellula hyalina]TVY23278.1 Serine/threonine-protein kinase [Lachnellula hyalina]